MCSLVSSSLSSRPRGRTGHERAHRCSPVSCMSLSVLSTPWGHRGHERALMCSLVSCLSFRCHGNTEDTSEHISARSCPHLSLFNTARTHRTRVSTSVLACVLYVLIPVPSMPWGHPGHERAHQCSLVSCVSLSLYLWIPRTQVSTLVLTGVLYVPIPVS